MNLVDGCPHADGVSADSFTAFCAKPDVRARLDSGHSKCNKCDLGPPHLWMCLTCNAVSCGRSGSKHSMAHFEKRKRHALCVNLSTRMIWCYQCDSEIVDPPEGADAKHPKFGVSAAVRAALESKHEEDSEAESGGDDADAAADDGSGLVGLANLGNTCFMNAALQSMANIPQLSIYFGQCQFTSVKSSLNQAPFATVFGNLLRQLWQSHLGHVRPRQVYHALCRLNNSFIGYGQHDSHEAIRYMLNALHEQLATSVPQMHEPNRLQVDAPASGGDAKDDTGEGGGAAGASGDASGSEAKPVAPAGAGGAGAGHAAGADEAKDGGARGDSEGGSGEGGGSGAGTGAVTTAQTPRYSSSIISDLFQGVLQSTVTCRGCNRVSRTRDRFYDLSLGIPSHGRVNPDEGRGWLSSMLCTVGRWLRPGEVTLEDCIHHFCVPERLTGDEQYYCEACKSRQDADKQFTIMKLPEVLCLQLKRFRHDAYWSSKVSTYVKFPIENLDMRQFVAPSDVFDNSQARYDLVSIVRHLGGMGGGHYVSYAKNRATNRWHKFDDSYVTRVHPDRVQRQEAYVLFYQRRRPELAPVRARIRALLNEGPTVAYVSKYWWMLWASHSSPGPPRVSDLVCEHGSVRRCLAESITGLVVPLTQQAVDRLREEFGPRPCDLLESIEECPTCVAEAEELAAQRALERKEVLAVDPVPAAEAVADEGEGALPWFLVTTEWVDSWRRFAFNEAPTPDGSLRGTPRPGPVDTESLLQEDGTPIPNLVRATHYRGVNKHVWSLFMKYYGGGPALRRPVLDLYAAVPGPVPQPDTEASSAAAGEADVEGEDEVDVGHAAAAAVPTDTDVHVDVDSVHADLHGDSSSHHDA